MAAISRVITTLLVCIAFALATVNSSSSSAINCDFDNDKTESKGCPFHYFVTELPSGDCSLEREWCMLIRYANFTITQGTASCRNNSASMNKCDSWGLCKKLMKGKTESRGCFVKRNVEHTNTVNGRKFQFPEVYVYCCKSGDRCNTPARYGNLSTCSQLASWPPAVAV